jgi:hypothetical protein
MKDEILAGLAASNFTLERNLEGITHKESLHQPGGEANCINWIAGHIVATRDQILSDFGVKKFFTDEESKPYGQGSFRIIGEENCILFSRIKEGLAQTYLAYCDFIGKQDDSFFKSPLSDNSFPFHVPEINLGKMLTVLLYHEGYHSGQLGLARRILGKGFDVKI